MKPAVKNAVESALVAVVAAATFLWFLIGATTAEGDETPKVILLALGMAASVITHLVFMVQAAHLDGRSRVLWAVLMCVTFPIASIVLLVQLYTRSSAPEQSAAG